MKAAVTWRAQGTMMLFVVSLARLIPACQAAPLCPLPVERTAAVAALNVMAACRESALAAGESASACAAPQGPACASSFLAGAFALIDSPNTGGPDRFDAARLGRQASCQAGIVRAVRALADQTLGGPAALPEIEGLAGSCDVSVARDESTGLTLPRSGPACSPAIGSPGEAVDVPALGRCLTILVETLSSRAAGVAPRPNIIVINTDDQRWDTLDAKHSVNGTSWVMGRVKQELVDSGVTFSQHFTPTPTCSPSRASLLTGQYAHVHGTLSNQPGFGAPSFPDAQTISVWLQAAGYRTGLIGKYMNLYENMQVAPGQWYVPPGWDDWQATTSDKYFSYYLVENSAPVFYGTGNANYATDVLRTKALTFISDSAALGKPFFLYFTPPAPHEPYMPAPRHVGSFTGVPVFRPASYNETKILDKPFHIRNTSLLTAAGRAQIDGWRHDALESLKAVDEAVFAIMNLLRSLSLDQTTMIVFTGDHGFLWGEHRLSGKEEPYEEAIRAPMIVRYPPLAPLARTESRLTTHMDISATLLSLAGATATIPQDGLSLEPVLDGSVITWRSDLLVENWITGHPWASVRDAQWKYSEYATGDLELYDLAADPFEMVNVATDAANAARIAAMRTRLRVLRPGWPQDVGCLDTDGDFSFALGGASYCGVAASDCDDVNSDAWATPGEAGTFLDFPKPGRNTLVWSAPAAPGCPAPLVKYDLIRARGPRKFLAAVCVESNDGPNATAFDPSIPGPGRAFFYLVRARNNCPAGVGPLGHASNGKPRKGAPCP